MKNLIAGFPGQLKEAFEIARKAEITKPRREIRNVVITGMGGSGIGGSLAAKMVANEMHIPLVANNCYFLPNFTYRDSLVIVSSYSGNTEETLNAFKIALGKGAHIVAVTSNGEVQRWCEEFDLQHIRIPGGKPPRAALGYSLVQQIMILSSNGLINSGPLEDLERAIEFLSDEQKTIRNNAEQLAKELKDKIPVFYTTTGFAPVAVRFRQQLNENAKMLAWHHVIPEMNHNEIVGWSRDYKFPAAVFLRHGMEYERNLERIEITLEIMKDHVPIHEVQAHGGSKIAQMLYLIHFGDWLSFHLAKLQNVDPMEIKNIDLLKKELGKLG